MKRLVAFTAAFALSGCIAVPAPIQPAPVAYQTPVQKQRPRVVRSAPKPVAAKPVAAKPVSPPAPFGGPVIPGRGMGGGGDDGSGGASDWGG